MAKVSALLFLLVGLMACDAREPMGIAHAEHRAVAQSIVNGTRDPQTVTLTDAQIMAIGWLYPVGHLSVVMCTATLVAPRVILTSSQCTPNNSPDDWGFGVGLTPTDPDATFGIVGIYSHATADVTMILLAEDVTASDLGITPLSINSATIDDSLLDQAVTIAGYGETQDADRDGRWFATVYVTEVNAEGIVVDGRGDQGACFGDSGGPLIDLDANGNPVILAVENAGELSCVDTDYLTRLDPIYDWIESILAGEITGDTSEGDGPADAGDPESDAGDIGTDPDLGDVGTDQAEDGSEGAPEPQSDDCGGCASTPRPSPDRFTLLALFALFATTRRRSAR